MIGLFAEDDARGPAVPAGSFDGAGSELQYGFFDAGRHALAMPLYTTDALILRTYQLGEADRIVVFLTCDRGKKRGVANGARRLRSRFVGGLEPLTRARLAYFEREGRDLVRLSYVEPVRSPLMAHADVLGHVEYFAELIAECAPEADPNTALYRLGAAVVDSLVDAIPVGPLARYVEYWVLRLQGVYPSLSAVSVARDATQTSTGQD